jgi:SAM-dependent methyltransferase
MANKLIPASHRKGRLLDIGCGYPLFLWDTDFAEKFGLDKMPTLDCLSDMTQNPPIIMHWDVEGVDTFPFESESFSVVTMLAVFEHIQPGKLVGILAEVHRILGSGGIFIMTTPAAWTDRLLRALAQLGLVSWKEIEEHKDTYNCFQITGILQEAKFERNTLRFGFFEAFMNIWATARK